MSCSPKCCGCNGNHKLFTVQEGWDEGSCHRWSTVKVMGKKIIEGKGGENNLYFCVASNCIGTSQEVCLPEAGSNRDSKSLLFFVCEGDDFLIL